MAKNSEPIPEPVQQSYYDREFDVPYMDVDLSNDFDPTDFEIACQTDAHNDWLHDIDGDHGVDSFKASY